MTIKLFKKNCGKHWGITTGQCKKCKYFATQDTKLVQHNGDPWWMIEGSPIPKTEYNPALFHNNK